MVFYCFATTDSTATWTVCFLFFCPVQTASLVGFATHVRSWTSSQRLMPYVPESVPTCSHIQMIPSACLLQNDTRFPEMLGKRSSDQVLQTMTKPKKVLALGCGSFNLPIEKHRAPTRWDWRLRPKVYFPMRSPETVSGETVGVNMVNMVNLMWVLQMTIWKSLKIYPHVAGACWSWPFPLNRTSARIVFSVFCKLGHKLWADLV